MQRQLVSSVIRQYSAEVKSVVFSNSTVDDATSIYLIIASLLECQNLETLALPVTTLTLQAVSGVVNLIEKNASSLEALSIPVDDEDLQAISSAIPKCTGLVKLTIGSPSLTNAAAPQVVNILRHQNRLAYFTLSGAMDDNGFSPIAEAIGALGETLDDLSLQCQL